MVRNPLAKRYVTIGLQVVVLIAAACTSLIADTLFVSRATVEQRIVSDNAFMKVQRSRIDELHALTRQSTLLSNPELDAEIPLYTAGNGKWLDVGRTGQYTVSLTQTVPLTGIQSAFGKAGEAEVDVASEELQVLRRRLVYESRVTIQRASLLRASYRTIDTQLNLLEELIRAYEKQVIQGNVSLREVVRLRAVYYNINDQRLSIAAQLAELQTSLRQLLGTTSYVVVIDSTPQSIDSTEVTVNRDSLIRYAMVQNPSITKAARAVVAAERYKSYEDRRWIDDPTLGVAYDKAGSYMPDYFALTVRVPLPLHNRNQGNRDVAAARISQAEIALQQERQKLENQLTEALDRLDRLRSWYSSSTRSYMYDAAEVAKGVLDNYRKGNLSLLEFVDFFESFMQSTIQINQMQGDMYEAIQYVKLLIGDENS